MKKTWAQPSLSRDFALLSAAILFILFLISVWITYVTYTKQTETIVYDLEKEAVRIENLLEAEIERANYLLNAMGQQIALGGGQDLVSIARMLKAFDNTGNIYSIFSWIGTDQKILVSSNRGVMDKPIDMSDRDYVAKALNEPWQMQIGRPIQGRLSDRWVIPVALGISDNTGKTLGIIMLSLDINTLTEQISQLVRRQGISFAIISKTLIPLTQVSNDKDFVTNNFPTRKLMDVDFSKASRGLIAKGDLFWGTGNYSYYQVSADYPYVVLLGYDAHYSDQEVRMILWSRLMEILTVAVFLVMLLWIVRVRIIRPVLGMTELLSEVSKGNPHGIIPDSGAIEIISLSKQINRIGEYVAENKRIENELRHKMFTLKQAKEASEMQMRSKSEHIAYICQELRVPLNNIIGFAQALKDQLYGPLENRKYRQYAADIYSFGNAVLSSLLDVMTMNKSETHYIALADKSLVIADCLHKALRFVADRMQSLGITAKVRVAETMPRLIADDFRLQQILTNILLVAVERMPAVGQVAVEADTLGEHREKAVAIITVTSQASPSYSPAELARLVERMAAGPAESQYGSGHGDTWQSHEIQDIRLDLARTLVKLHGGIMDMQVSDTGQVTIVVLFPAGRLNYSGGHE
jgi:signal transduction histidine kinase